MVGKILTNRSISKGWWGNIWQIGIETKLVRNYWLANGC